MTQDDIIAMAHEASPDMTWYAAVDNPSYASKEELKFLGRFAALVAAAERKVIIESLHKQADLATDALDRRWALEMIAAVAARSNT